MKFEFLTFDYEPCPPDQVPARFGFECPKRPGFMCTGLMIRRASEPKPEYPSWIWDGNRDAPTFFPSINCMNCSHGFVEAGVWRDA